MVTSTTREEFKTNYVIFYNKALLFTRKHEDAEDLIQKVFLKLLQMEMKGKLIPDERTGYILTMIKNQFLNDKRSYSKMPIDYGETPEKSENVENQQSYSQYSIWDIAEKANLSEQENIVLQDWMNKISQDISAKKLGFDKNGRNKIRTIRQRIQRKLTKVALNMNYSEAEENSIFRYGNVP